MENQINYRDMPLELKSLKDDGTFTGYASIFGNVDAYGDVVVKGAFESYLSANTASDVKLLWQHSTDKPIGVFTKIIEDAKGLYVEGKLLINDLVLAREVLALLKADAISGLSIGFRIEPGGSEYKDGVRVLTNLSLWEISIVTFPANDRAQVASVKTIENVRDFEVFLRDVGGFKAARAKQIASCGFVKGIQREVEISQEDELIQNIKHILSTFNEELRNHESRN